MTSEERLTNTRINRFIYENNENERYTIKNIGKVVIRM